MLTLFHMLAVFGAVVGAVSGASSSIVFLSRDPAVVVLCGVGGGVAGWCLGSIPAHHAARSVMRDLRRKTSDELRAHLRGPIWPAYHLYLAELVARGEDVAAEIDVPMQLLWSNDPVKRAHGITILRRCFPSVAATLHRYDPQESTKVCRAHLAEAGLSSPGEEGAAG
jgi:hypothetical protein